VGQSARHARLGAPQHRPRPRIAQPGQPGRAAAVALSFPLTTRRQISRQVQVGPYFADFLCHELRRVVEIDGFSHDLRPDYDTARDRWLRGEGYQVLRFTNAELLGISKRWPQNRGTKL